MSVQDARDVTQPDQDFAFYYPGHLWYSGDWIKNLLLFFDGIALLIPEYKLHEPELVDPVIAGPLVDLGLLRYLNADEAVDAAATAQLARSMAEILSSGKLDRLALEDTAFHSLSYSRLGGYGDEKLADQIFRELKKRKLARDSEDGVSIPMHPLVRALVLTLLSQILRSRGKTLGVELSPATDRPDLVNALKEVLSIHEAPSMGAVVAFDLETVGVDLRDVPIDEVLSFRRENLKEYALYRGLMRQFMSQLSLIPEEDRKVALRNRQEEIRARADQLRTAAEKAWRRPTAFALTIAGSVVGVAGAPIPGAALTALGTILGLYLPNEAPVDAFSYLFRSARLK